HVLWQGERTTLTSRPRSASARSKAAAIASLPLPAHDGFGPPNRRLMQISSSADMSLCGAAIALQLLAGELEADQHLEIRARLALGERNDLLQLFLHANLALLGRELDRALEFLAREHLRLVVDDGDEVRQAGDTVAIGGTAFGGDHQLH